MKDTLIAAVRTGVQALVALLTAIPLIAMFDLGDELTLLLNAIGVGLVTLALNYLEGKFPFLTPFLSLGATSDGPSYEPA